MLKCGYTFRVVKKFNKQFCFIIYKDLEILYFNNFVLIFDIYSVDYM